MEGFLPQGKGFSPSADDIADALWLTLQMGVESASESESIASDTPVPVKTTRSNQSLPDALPPAVVPAA